MRRTELAAESLTVARALLGTHLVSEVAGEHVRLRLTEVEAYAGEVDPASHAFRGRTARNAVMFGPAGHLYVYFTYGMHYCCNVVCGPQGRASAVLLRAGAVVDGVEVARLRRPAARTDRDLARGPARLASTLGVDRSHDGVDLLAAGSPIRLLGPLGTVPTSQVASGPRVGVTAAAENPWRFWVRDEPSVSTYRRGTRRSRPG